PFDMDVNEADYRDAVRDIDVYELRRTRKVKMDGRLWPKAGKPGLSALEWLPVAAAAAVYAVLAVYILQNSKGGL
ncbi:hypothetical protein, partial [Klebsiella variicola]|uniref:hypothetical protein n=1 Tax=Klebsiella variicola TaxID=244366 RepID=UPI002730EB88